MPTEKAAWLVSDRQGWCENNGPDDGDRYYRGEDGDDS